MKEYIEVINDSFVDYTGKTHYFTIAAISQMLPCKAEEVDDDFSGDVTYEVSEIISDFDISGYIGTVRKALYLGISICNPTDAYDEKIGRLKAIARARKSKPALFSTNPGTINTKVVKALLEQEAEYLKNNPENFIKGYNESKAHYEKNKEMEIMAANFTDIEKAVITKMQENPMFLNNAFEYLEWLQKKNHK